MPLGGFCRVYFNGRCYHLPSNQANELRKSHLALSDRFHMARALKELQRAENRIIRDPRDALLRSEREERKREIDRERKKERNASACSAQDDIKVSATIKRVFR